MDTNNKMTESKFNKSAQVVHEAEITRQHARYKIPAILEIDEKKFILEDWSVSGCSIKDVPPDLFKKNFIMGKLIFQFDDFETAIHNLKVEFISKKSEDIIGCRFTEMTPQQLSILNQIIASYLSGDIVTEDDIIHAVTRIQTYEKKENNNKANKNRFSLILFLMYSVIFMLVSFLVSVFYQRTYIVPTNNAFIDANITVVRSPSPSYIHYIEKLHKNTYVKINQTLAIANLVTGGSQRIIAPINAKIFKFSAREGEFRNVAEPVIYLLPQNTDTLFLKAHIWHKDLKKIHVNDIAKIRTIDGDIFYAKIVTIVPAQSILNQKNKILVENIYANPRTYDTVTLTTNYSLTENMVSQSITVTIDTFLNRHGLIDENNTSFFNYFF